MFLLPSKQKQTHNSYGDKNPISLWKVFCTHPYFDKEVKSNSKIWARVCILSDETHCLCWLVRPVIFQPLFKVTHTTKFIPDPRRWSASSQAQLFGFLPRRNSDLPSHHYTIMSMRSANLLDDLYNMASWLPLQCFGRARNGCEYFGLYTSPSPLFFYGRGNAVVSTVVRKVGGSAKLLSGVGACADTLYINLKTAALRWSKRGDWWQWFEQRARCSGSVTFKDNLRFKSTM